MNVNNYYNFLPVAQDTHSQVSGMQEKLQLAEVSTDSELLSYFYNELNNISVILSNPATTEEQALQELGKYNELIKRPEFSKLMLSHESEASHKIKDIQESMEYYFLKKEMVTFGYFVDKMDVASKYGHDLSVKCYRDGFSQYTEFYKTLSKLLSSYGEYSAGVIDDGKKTKFRQNAFYYDLHMALMKFYPVTGDLKNDAGKDCSIYKGRFEIDTKNGVNNCSIYVDGELIDSNVIYSDAIKKMEYFFSVMRKPVSGTGVIKKINTETDRDGNLVKITGMVDVMVMPEALFRWLDFSIKKEDFDEINSFFDQSMDKLKKFNNINDDYSSVSSLYEDALKKTSDYFNDKLNNSYFKTAVSGRNEEWNLDQGKINSYNTIIDGIKKELQMTLDEFSQRYNTINSNYDNMLRVITTMISELTQELKGFLRI
ncbi:hypothetical protein [Morganella sp. GD04133]|uniref:hypothetical protein n=1 Tax=Morganella sp. GD04133 TaxID=2975435 RepID=UPI00244B133A|nr:hypothetical protein [Morganella sp. GD04133]MDH0353775.1 hypothetical protein [Morganella sp. GD04133]